MHKMTCLPIESMPPTAITASISVDNLLYIARCGTIELYETHDTDLLFVGQNIFDEPISHIFNNSENLILVLQTSIIVINPFSLLQTKVFPLQAPGEA